MSEANNFLQKIAAYKNRLAHWAYPGFSILIFALIALSFVQNAAFLSREINRAVNVSEDAGNEAFSDLNMEDFAKASAYAGFKIQEPPPKPEEAPANPLPQDAAASPPATSTPAAEKPKSLSKSDLVIEIYNSTRQSGLAGKTKSLLENNGYKISQTGNRPPALDKTQIQTKSGSAQDPALLEILEIIKTSFPGALITEADLPQNQLVIILGNN